MAVLISDPSDQSQTLLDYVKSGKVSYIKHAFQLFQPKCFPLSFIVKFRYS